MVSRKSSRRRYNKRNTSNAGDTNGIPLNLRERNGKINTPIIESITHPFAGLSKEERKQAISELSSKNQLLLKENLLKLTEIIKTYDPLSIISILSNYALTATIGSKTTQPKEMLPGLGQPQVEIFQAIILKIPENEWGREPVLPYTTQEVIDQLRSLISASSFARMKAETFDLPEQDLEITQFQEMVRSHTSGVRNWGYYSQVKRIILELYAPFDKSLKDRFGFSVNEAVSVFDYTIMESERLMSERFKFLKEIRAMPNKVALIKKYFELKGESSGEMGKLLKEPEYLQLDLENLFILLLSYEDQNLEHIFSFLPEKVAKDCGINKEAVENIFNYFSLSPGDLRDIDSEHFFLDNPIWKKPIIKLDDKYFSPVSQVFFSKSFSILDSLVEQIDKKGLSERRSRFLEKKIEEIVMSRFPEQSTARNIRWKYQDKEFETDLITFIDSYAIIIEAKSHKITSQALRGADKRIKKHIEEVIVDPSVQSKRLEDRLRELIAKPDLDDKLRKKLPVDLSKIQKIIRISVSLEDFATMQANISRFNLTGWIPDSFVPCPTLNLADFETVFEMLEHPVQILHYFERRSELELDDRMEILGFELDYLGFYMQTLFSHGYIQESGKDIMVITEMSKSIDDYHTLRDQGIDVVKPSPTINPLFKKIFRKLEERSIPRWTEIGATLNRFSPMDQERISEYIDQLKLKVIGKWQSKDLKNIVLYTPPVGSDYGLAYILFNDETKHRKYEFVDSAAALLFEQARVKFALIIAKNLDYEEDAYHYISFVSPSVG